MLTSQQLKKALQIYFIAGTQDTNGSYLQLLNVLDKALTAGITCFQYRKKGANSLKKSLERKRMARACQRLCRKHQVPFIINDDIELALEIDADGIHVGQNDEAISKVIQKNPNKIIGLSCHNVTEITYANTFKEISYYGIGPIFPTSSKLDADKPLGLDQLKTMVAVAKKPTVAIGGISIKNAVDIWQSNADGLAIISAITQAENLEETIELLKFN